MPINQNNILKDCINKAKTFEKFISINEKYLLTLYEVS